MDARALAALVVLGTATAGGWTSGIGSPSAGAAAENAAASNRQAAGSPSGPGSSPGQSPREAHGDFTGDIKPVLYVRDVQRSATFFRDALGFELLGFADLEGEPYYVEMAAGARKFGLHEPLSPEQENRIGRQRLYFRVRDLAAHRRHVLAWEVEAGPVQETDWMDMFIVIDADGHEIVFASTDPDSHTSDPW